jgi:hypothetical protein
VTVISQHASDGFSAGDMTHPSGCAEGSSLEASLPRDDRTQERPLRRLNPNKLLPLPRIDLVSGSATSAHHVLLPVLLKPRAYMCRNMSEENDISVSSLVSTLHAATDEN